MPASVSLLSPRRHQAVAGDGGRRRAAADPDLQPVQADEQPRVASDHAGRVASRNRAERGQPHARAARRRAVQRSVRRVGVLVAGAARERRADRGGRQLELQPLRQLRDGRRHPLRHEPARRAHVRAEIAVRQPQQPQAGLPRQPRVGQGRASPSTGTCSIPTGIQSCGENERGKVDNNAAVEFWNLNAKLDYNPTDRVRAFFRAGYFDENRDNGKKSTIDGTEEANDTTWRSVSGGVRARLPDQSDLQATIFSDVETFHSNFLAVPAATPAAEHRPDDAPADRPHDGRRRDGPVVAGVRRGALRHGRDRFPVGGRRQRGAGTRRT